MRVCSICKCDSPAERELYDNRYGYPGIFELTRCKKCGHRELRSEFNEEEIRRLYTDFYPRATFDLNDHKPYSECLGLRAWLDGSSAFSFRWVPKGVRVLDIGCGFGETLGYHKMRGCDVWGVEADVNIKKVADKFGYKVHVGVFDPGLYERDFFDFVTLDQVIEHMKDPLAVLQGAARVLKPDGRIIIAMPNIEGWGAKVFGSKWVHWHAPYHLHFFSSRSMESIARNAGLEIELKKTATPSDWLFHQWLHLFFSSEEGKQSPYWSRRMTTTQKAIWFLVRLATHRTNINHLLTRIFDFFNMGDNTIFILRKQRIKS